MENRMRLQCSLIAQLNAIRAATRRPEDGFPWRHIGVSRKEFRTGVGIEQSRFSAIPKFAIGCEPERTQMTTGRFTVLQTTVEIVV